MRSRSNSSQGEGIANPHERVSLKHEITQEDMKIDEQQKLMFLDQWLSGGEEIKPVTLRQGIRA